jgi:hypothetical protein
VGIVARENQVHFHNPRSVGCPSAIGGLQQGQKKPASMKKNHSDTHEKTIVGYRPVLKSGRDSRMQLFKCFYFFEAPDRRAFYPLGPLHLKEACVMCKTNIHSASHEHRAIGLNDVIEISVICNL